MSAFCVSWFLRIVFLFSVLGFLDGRLFVGFSTFTCQSNNAICLEIRKCPYFEDLLNRSPIPRPRNVIKIIRENQCGFFRNTPYVCCEKDVPTTTTTPKPTTTTTTTSKPTTTTTTEMEEFVTEGHLFEELTSDPVRTHPNFHLLPNEICGPISTNSRITSGSRTGLNEFPWMALIAYYVDGEVDFRCGGTLINDRYVLTAAHCILNSTIVGVRLGEHNLDTQEDCDPDYNYCAPPTQDFYIEHILVHPEYNPKTFVNDVALIRLAKPANLSFTNVQPICLPTGDDNLSGRFAIVTGWGVTEDGFKSADLRKVSMPVVSITNCQRVYRNFAPITHSQICAGGYQGKDSCGGDSGGPMQYAGLIDGTPRFIQYGIVSYGPRHCGTDGKPGIYTKVSKYVEWILDCLKPSKDK